ncbi:hypothetical protein M9458_050092, partial [Cirrhinus mrigala]
PVWLSSRLPPLSVCAEGDASRGPLGDLRGDRQPFQLSRQQPLHILPDEPQQG